jgi:hypothetical protein
MGPSPVRVALVNPVPKDFRTNLIHLVMKKGFALKVNPYVLDPSPCFSSRHDSLSTPPPPRALEVLTFVVIMKSELCN